MKKRVSKTSLGNEEDRGLLRAMKIAEHSGKGSLVKVKAHLKRIASSKK